MLLMTAAPPNVRHAMTRWMIEPAPGVFVGTLSARVRDELWEAVQGAVRDGWGLMIEQSNNEQGFAIRVCGTERRRIVEYDGLQLVARPDSSLTIE